MFEAVRQRSKPKHFILKVIWRKCPIPGYPALFQAPAGSACARTHESSSIGAARPMSAMPLIATKFCRGSFQFDADLVDNRFPFARLLRQRCGKLLCGSNPCLHADGLQVGADLCRPESFVYRAVKPLDDRHWRSCRSEQPEQDF